MTLYEIFVLNFMRYLQLLCKNRRVRMRDAQKKRQKVQIRSSPSLSSIMSRHGFLCFNAQCFHSLKTIP